MIDAWSGPTPIPQQFPANEPNGIRKLLDKIKALELQIKEATSNLLGTAGIRLTQLGMFIDSSLTVGGSLDVTGPMVVGGTADFDGDTTIGGNAAITGTLSLPAGIIDNDALANPVKPSAVSFSASHTLTTTLTSVASTTVTVPAGFTSAVVSGLGTVYMNDPNTTGGQDGLGADYVSSTFTIDGTSVGSSALGLAYGNGGAATSLAVVSSVLTGLTPGGTFVLGIKAKTDYFTITGGWIMVSGTVLWFR